MEKLDGNDYFNAVSCLAAGVLWNDVIMTMKKFVAIRLPPLLQISQDTKIERDTGRHENLFTDNGLFSPSSF